MSNTAPTSPSTYAFPRPISPTKDALKPNAHPYPIKTTSTGLLSRSNSSPKHHSHHNSSYHYVPSHSPSPTRALPTPGLSGRAHGHQYSKSLSSDQPRPLPIPPSFPSPSASPTNQFNTPPPRRSKRAETLPSLPASPPSTAATHEDLPSNPKTWTPTELSKYLATALRVKSGEALNLPLPVARDIAAFVKQSKITGKSFLRFKESDLEVYEINKPWRTALLAASRNLRQNVLRGRIWGFGPADVDARSQSDVEEEEDGTPNNRLRSNSDTNPFASAMYSSGSSSSSVDLTNTHTPVRRTSAGGRYRNGRVKGMVASFERSSSVDDDDVGRARRQRSSSVGSFDGHVHDGGEMGEDEEVDIYATERPPAFPLFPHHIQDSSESESRGTGTGTTEFETASEAESEPTVEELLASSAFPPSTSMSMTTSTSSGVHAWEMGSGIGETMKHVGVDASNQGSRGQRAGVHAWEAEDGVGVTVKHVGEAGTRAGSGEEGLGNSVVSAESWGMIGSLEGSAQADVGGTKGKEKAVRGRGRRDERRLVSDIFIGAPNVDAQVQVDRTLDAGENVDVDVGVGEMESTRSLVHAFKVRLEEVERKVDDMEERERERERAQVLRKQQLELEALRKQREEANRRLEEKVQKLSQAEEERKKTGLGKLSLSMLDPRTILGRILRLATASTPADSPSSRAADVKKKGRRIRHPYLNDRFDPKSVSALPSYLLMVGIGVCAVVLRVVLRRVVTRGIVRR